MEKLNVNELVSYFENQLSRSLTEQEQELVIWIIETNEK